MFSIKIDGNYESLWTNFLSALIATKYCRWMVFIWDILWETRCILDGIDFIYRGPMEYSVVLESTG